MSGLLLDWRTLLLIAALEKHERQLVRKRKQHLRRVRRLLIAAAIFETWPLTKQLRLLRKTCRCEGCGAKGGCPLVWIRTSDRQWTQDFGCRHPGVRRAPEYDGPLVPNFLSSQQRPPEPWASLEPLLHKPFEGSRDRFANMLLGLVETAARLLRMSTDPDLRKASAEDVARVSAEIAGRPWYVRGIANHVSADAFADDAKDPLGDLRHEAPQRDEEEELTLLSDDGAGEAEIEAGIDRREIRGAFATDPQVRLQALQGYAAEHAKIYGGGEAVQRTFALIEARVTCPAGIPVSPDDDPLEWCKQTWDLLHDRIKKQLQRAKPVDLSPTNDSDRRLAS